MEYAAFAFAERTIAGHIVETEYDVLRRNDNRLTMRRRKDIVRRHHQYARFDLSFERERYVNGHLVTVEVGIEGGTNQRMQLNRFTFDKLWLERLDTKSVERRSAVQENRVLFYDFFENVPNFRTFLLHHLLRGLNRGYITVFGKLVVNERLEELESHLLRQTALMQFQLRTHYDYRTARVVNAFTEQVLVLS